MMPWFRLYTEAWCDPKLRTLSDAQFRVWFNLLCYAAQQGERGVIHIQNLDVLADMLVCGTSARTIEEKRALLGVTCNALAALHVVTCNAPSALPGVTSALQGVTSGVTLDVTDGFTIAFTNFERRQFDKPSDANEKVRARVAKCRAKRRYAKTPQSEPKGQEGLEPSPICNAPCNAPCNAHIDSDSDTDYRGEEIPPRRDNGNAPEALQDTATARPVGPPTPSPDIHQRAVPTPTPVPISQAAEAPVHDHRVDHRRDHEPFIPTDDGDDSPPAPSPPSLYADPDFIRLSNYINELFCGDYQGLIARTIESEGFSLRWIREAATLARDRGKTDWSYVKGILRRFREQGGPDSQRPQPPRQEQRHGGYVPGHVPSPDYPIKARNVIPRRRSPVIRGDL